MGGGASLSRTDLQQLLAYFLLKKYVSLPNTQFRVCFPILAVFQQFWGRERLSDDASDAGYPGDAVLCLLGMLAGDAGDAGWGCWLMMLAMLGVCLHIACILHDFCILMQFGQTRTFAKGMQHLSACSSVWVFVGCIGWRYAFSGVCLHVACIVCRIFGIH